MLGLWGIYGGSRAYLWGIYGGSRAYLGKGAK
jgi:hypothetical protein